MENCFWALKSPHTRMKPKKNRPIIYYDPVSYTHLTLPTNSLV